MPPSPIGLLDKPLRQQRPGQIRVQATLVTAAWRLALCLLLMSRSTSEAPGRRIVKNILRSVVAVNQRPKVRMIRHGLDLGVAVAAVQSVGREALHRSA